MAPRKKEKKYHSSASVATKSTNKNKKKPSKISDAQREKIRRMKRESEQRRRDRIKEDPVLYEEHKRKERERYKARTECGKIKKVSQMSDREKRVQRKAIREKVKRHREKKKKNKEVNQILEQNTPPPSDNDSNAANVMMDEKVIVNEPNIGRAGTSLEESGKRVLKRNKSKCYREMKKLKKELEESKRRGDKYKKKFFRLRNKVSNKNSPRTKVRTLLSGESVSPKVRKCLEFSSALTTQIQENFNKNKQSRKSLKAFALVLSGKIIKKYKAVRKMKDCVQSYYKRMQHVDKGKNIYDTLKTALTYKTKNQIKIKSDVIKFFEQDDVSRLEPGKKDCITKGKVKKQKRILMGNLKSLQKKFEVEFGYNISYSTFCSFRPFWVVLANIKYRKTCLCEKHENFEFVFKKLKDLKVIEATDSDQLIKSLCCEGEKTKEICLERKCKECKHNEIKIQLFQDKEIEIEQWVWKRENILVKGKEKIIKKIIKEKIKTSIKNVVQMLLDMKAAYINHVANIIHQYQAIYDLKKGLQDNDVLIHIDFSENYECKYFQEIQSVHFGGSHQQVTLHTGVVYLKQKDSDLKIISVCSLSESLRHDAPAIAAHIEKIISYIKRNYVSNIKNLHFLSDSPVTQYRNKSMFYLIKVYLSKFCLESLTWNYSESGHGKGAPDGVGGTLKRTADRLIAEGQDLADFKSLFNALKEKTKIQLFTVVIDEIKKMDKMLNLTLTPFLGTMKCHQVVCASTSQVLNMRRLSCFKCRPEDKCQHYHQGSYNPVPVVNTSELSNKSHPKLRYSDVYSSDSDVYSSDSNTEERSKEYTYTENTFVLVKFCTTKNTIKHYVGVVQSSVGQECTIKFLRKSGQDIFVFPPKDDVFTVDIKDILLKLQQPLLNNRGHYRFSENLAKYKIM